jgi:DNA-binding GntR family transcriptional regulator
MSKQEDSAGQGGPGAKRLEELIQRLGDDIDLARLAPGQAIPIDGLARRLRCLLKDTAPVIAHFVQRGLLRLEGESCIVAPLDRSHLLAELDRRLALEQQVAEAAAKNPAAIDRVGMEHAASLLRRSAMVGDIEGYMAADRRLEKLIAAASGLPEVAEQIFAIKREFRRAWCAHNRLRDLNEPAGLRRALVEAILRGKPEEATAAVRRFIEYLRKSF